MSASGLVYAAIVLMWAAVLIPMWVRRHDAGNEGRSAERFGQAMRVLSRRESSMDRREIVLPASPRATGATAAAVSGGSRRSVGSPAVTARRIPATTPARRPAATRPSSAAARASLARRRARTLAVLGGLAVLLGVLALLSVVPSWAPLPIGLLLVGFVVHLRLEARRAQRRRSQRQVPSSRGGRGSGGGAERLPTTARTRPAQPREELPEEERADTSRALVVETKGTLASATVAAGLGVEDGPAVADRGAEPMPEPAADDWQPNPLPLPTYVSAPKAMRPIRVIDLTTPGAWTSGRLLDDEVPVVADALATAEADAEELDALLEHDVALDEQSLPKPDRRAVGD